MKRFTTKALIAALLLTTAGCGNGGAPIPGPPVGTPGSPGTPTPTPPPSVFTPPQQIALTSAQVQQVIANAAQEAQARGIGATIAVVDRVGNVLAVWQTNNADRTLRVPDAFGGAQFNTGLQGLTLDATLNAARFAAIAKAVTGAYLSSGGNAFSTRTASQIVQEHFPPSAVAVGLESGPLYGVQFSSLPCSDLVARFNPGGGSLYRTTAGADVVSPGLIGPKRTPLGLSADPGGFPLYINGVMVGGVGVITDGLYGIDREIRDVDRDNDEAVAIAATRGFEAPANIRAERITVDGTTLRYTDIEVSQIQASGPAPAFTTINGTIGAFQDTPAYFTAAGGARPGTAYGTEASGIRASTAAEFSNRDAFVLTDGNGNNRFPIRGGTEGNAQALTAAETRAILEEAFLVMSAARAQIRQPLDSRAEVSLSVVDTNGAVLGVVRSPDAPIFGIDVSLQKARTAMFFSAPFAAQQLLGVPGRTSQLAFLGLNTVTRGNRVAQYVPATRTFVNDPNFFTGQIAFSNRAIGNLARPYFPDGEIGRPNGPLSPDIRGFNPFSVGIQSDLIVENVVQHVLAGLGAGPDTPSQCTDLPNRNLLANGIQIFPGSVPIYRGNQLVGAIGISGDGIDQDDMISFLGTHNAGVRLGGFGNAPVPIRSDQLVVRLPNADVRLRYVGCPFAPFIGSNDQNVCQGK
jgi:uncharacterized protein GlcG (DUF336 family)